MNIEINLTKQRKIGIVIFLILLLDLLNGSHVCFSSSWSFYPITLPKLLFPISILIFILWKFIHKFHTPTILSIAKVLFFSSIVILILTSPIKRYQQSKTNESLDSICYALSDFAIKERQYPIELWELKKFGSFDNRSYYRLFSNQIQYNLISENEFELIYASEFGRNDTITNCFSNYDTFGNGMRMDEENHIREYHLSKDIFILDYHCYLPIDRNKTKYSIQGDSIIHLEIICESDQLIKPCLKKLVNQSDSNLVLSLNIKNLRFSHSVIKNRNYETLANEILVDEPSFRMGTQMELVDSNQLNLKLDQNYPASIRLRKTRSRIEIYGNAIINNKDVKIDGRLNL